MSTAAPPRPRRTDEESGRLLRRYAEFRDPNYAAVPALRRMVTAGQLGRKSGKGFYDYSK